MARFSGGSGGGSGATGPTGPTGPQGPAGQDGQGFRFREEWIPPYPNDGKGPYATSDVVFYQGSSYVAISDIDLDSTPGTNTNGWALFTAKGDDGANGIGADEVITDTSANWTENNPVLDSGIIGVDTTNIQFRIGDGVNAWADLPYFVNSSDLGGQLDGFLLEEEKGEALGVATLDETGKVPESQLPASQASSQSIHPFALGA